MDTGQVEAAEYALDVLLDAAEWIRETGKPVRWFLAEAEETSGPPTRIVLETPRPPVWWWRVGAVVADSSERRLVPRLFMAPELLDAWEASDRLHMAAFDGDEGERGRTYVDVATTERDLAEWFEGFYRNDRGPRGAFRTRRQMLEEALDLRQALAAWEAGDDSALAEECREFADMILSNGRTRASMKAQIRWSHQTEE